MVTRFTLSEGSREFGAIVNGWDQLSRRSSLEATDNSMGWPDGVLR